MTAIVFALSEPAQQALVAVWDALVDHEGQPIDAPCNMAPDLWFPGKGESGDFAKEVCKKLCPARDECAVFALLNGETSGIWGGRSANAIRRAAKKQTPGIRRPAA